MTETDRPLSDDAWSRAAASTGDVSLLEHTDHAPGRRCEWCKKPLPAGLRPEAEYCDKRCRQAASRRRVRARGPVPEPVARERCAWCEKPLPAGRRPEAEYCDKRCRQASSRFGLAVKRSAPAPPADSDASRRLSEEAPRDTSSTETTAGRQLDATRRARGPEQRLANRAAASRDASRMPRDAEQRKLAGDALADVSDASPALADDPLAQPSVRALVLDALGEHDRRVLLEGGTPRHEHSTSSGPLRPEVALRREIRVAQYTPAAWRSQVAWHVYWRQHDYDTLDEQLRAGSPPTPRSEHRTERVTWGQARKWVRENAVASTAAGADDTSPTPSASAELDATRRRRMTPGGMRFGYADPPYPGKADIYPEHQEVDHDALVARLVSEFPDGWALSTSADALQDVLAVCPPGVRVCSWHRPVRRTRSRRPLSAWEPLIVYGGRELSTTHSQTVTDALEYRGRFRAVGIERR